MGQKPSGNQPLGLLAVIASLTLGFYLLGSHPTFAFEWSLIWFDRADPEIALAVLLRLTGLLCSCWLLLSGTLYALATCRGRVPRTIRWITIPPIRRMVDRFLAAALAVSALTVPAHPVAAAEDPEPAIVFEIHSDGIPLPLVRLEPAAPIATPVKPPPGAATAASPMPLLPTPAVAAQAAVPPGAALTDGDHYAVAPGDNLWLIAEAQIQTATGDMPADQIVASYWRRLIDANIANLRSGDPNLIYVGEILTLPRLEAQP